jgi:hypothetical protein
MAETSQKKQAEARWRTLVSERSSWMDHWRDISEVLLPRTGRFMPTENNKGDRKKYREILDNTGTRALRTLSGGMMSGMTSPARPWFRLTTFNPELDESYEVKTWMSKVTSLMQMVFYKSNVYRALQMAYEELGAYGTSATILLDDYENVIHCMPLTIGEFAISADSRGRVDTLYREFRMTVAMLVREFGYARCSESVQRLWDENKFDEWVTVINAIEPRKDYDPKKKNAKNMPWKSLYFEEGSKEDLLLRETGFREFPALVARWAVTGGDIYGNSPGMEALGDLKQLQAEQLCKSQAIALQVNPPLLMPFELKNAGSQVVPGGIIPYSNTQQATGIRSAFDVNLRLDYLLSDIADIRNRVKEAFYTDIFMMMVGASDKTMTATEVAERHEEKMLLMGPVLERLNAEMLDPLISRTFARMVEANMLPPIPEELQGMSLNVEFISILAQSQKAISTNAIDRFCTNLGVIAGSKPEVLDNFDADFWAQYYSDALGIDPRFIVAGDQVALIRQQREQAAQQQAQMEQLQQMAGVAKNVGVNAGDMQSQSPDQIAQAFSGY